jgi:hypothetical protein
MANCGFLATFAQLREVPDWWSTSFTRRQLAIHIMEESTHYQVMGRGWES